MNKKNIQIMLKMKSVNKNVITFFYYPEKSARFKYF